MHSYGGLDIDDPLLGSLKIVCRDFIVHNLQKNSQIFCLEVLTMPSIPVWPLGKFIMKNFSSILDCNEMFVCMWQWWVWLTYNN